MRQVKNVDELKALPLCVVLRTAAGTVIERDDSGCWSAMGTETSLRFTPKAFPAQVLWTYLDEITSAPGYIDPDMAVELVRQLRDTAQARQQAVENGVDLTGNIETPEGDHVPTDDPAAVATPASSNGVVDSGAGVGIPVPHPGGQPEDQGDGGPGRPAADGGREAHGD